MSEDYMKYDGSKPEPSYTTTSDLIDRIAELESALALCAAGPWRKDFESLEHGKYYSVILDGFFGGLPQALCFDGMDASYACWRLSEHHAVTAWLSNTLYFSVLHMPDTSEPHD